jgi:hypothetical protein
LKGKWTAIKKLNDNINTKYWESHASVSYDGKTLYFTSNRKGGYGGLDIYSSTRADVNQDNWEKPVNLGPDINTPFNEETPFISPDGKTLYFSSYGHFNMGGYDIFYSNLLENGKWSVPLNMGYPINTTDDDLFYVPVQDGNFAYVCRYYPEENYGKTDIYRVEIFSSQHPRKFLLKGLVNVPSELKGKETLNLVGKLVNRLTHDTVQLLTINPEKARFDTKIGAGDYQLIVEGKGIQKSVEEFSIKNNQASDEVTVNASIKAIRREPEQIAKLAEPIIGIMNFDKSFYKTFDSKKIPILLNLEKGSNVTVKIYHDSAFVRTEQLLIKKKKQNYLFVPSPGKNVLKFRSQNADNKIFVGEVEVDYEPLPDTLSKFELAKEMADRQYKLNYTKNYVACLSSGDLRTVLEQLNIQKENLSTLADLTEYLKNKAQFKKIKIAEVDSLFNLFTTNQPLATKLLLEGISNLSDSSLAKIIDTCIKKDFKSVNDAVEFMILQSKGNNDASLALLSATSKLADAGNVYYYYKALQLVAPDNLKKLLDTLNLRKTHVSTPDDLMNLLIRQSSKGGYSQDDVFKSFLLIPLFTNSSSELMATMLDLSQGKMKAFLKTIGKIGTGKSVADVELLLYEKAKQARISPKDLMSLIFKANTDFYFNQFVNDFNLFATGKLKVLLKNTDIHKENINTSNEFMNFILNKYKNEEANSDLIRVFSQIASKNLIKENEFSYSMKKKFNLSPFLIGLFSVLFILFMAIIIFGLRKKYKPE